MYPANTGTISPIARPPTYLRNAASGVALPNAPPAVAPYPQRVSIKNASATKIPKEWREDKEFMALVEDIPLNYGYIICKCNLVDCIEMTNEYVEKIKKENYQEYICGRYEPGRYAWILENIEILENPIETKGHLGVWNYEK